MKKIATIILTVLVFILVGLTVYINFRKEEAIDRSKIPSTLELSKGFQKWITNLKNKSVVVEADEFRLIDETEVFNTKWMKVYAINDPTAQKIQEGLFNTLKETPKVIFSPDGSSFIDYRSINRDSYSPDQVRYFGPRGDKIIDLRAAGCFTRTNCYFDRGFFVDNDIFAVTEFSLSDPQTSCNPDTTCLYTIKIHLIDLATNEQDIYTSLPKELNLTLLKPEL